MQFEWLPRRSPGRAGPWSRWRSWMGAPVVGCRLFELLAGGCRCECSRGGAFAAPRWRPCRASRASRASVCRWRGRRRRPRGPRRSGRRSDCCPGEHRDHDDGGDQERPRVTDGVVPGGHHDEQIERVDRVEGAMRGTIRRTRASTETAASFIHGCGVPIRPWPVPLPGLQRSPRRPVGDECETDCGARRERETAST